VSLFSHKRKKKRKRRRRRRRRVLCFWSAWFGQGRKVFDFLQTER
jgi:hypothetical protein